jgi:hypothetical protein
VNLLSAFISWKDASGTQYSFYPDLVVSEKWTEGAAVTEHPVEQGANIVDHVRVELVKCELVIFATNEPIGPNSFAVPVMGTASLEGLPGPAIAAAVFEAPEAVVWNNELALKAALLGAGGAIGGAIGGAVGNAVGAAAGALAGAFLAQPSAELVAVPTTTTLTVAPQVEGTGFVQVFAEGTGVQAGVDGLPNVAVDFVSATIGLLASLKNTAQILTLNGSKEVNTSMVIESLAYVREEGTGTGAEITIDFKEIRIIQTLTVNVPLPSVPRAATPTSQGQQNPSDASASVQESAAYQIEQPVKAVYRALVGS